MKLKKFLMSKLFIAGSLVVVCVGILAVCLIQQKDEKDEFLPEQPSTAAAVESWTENPSPTESEKEIETNDNEATKPPKNEEYPKVVESDDNKTVVEFTDPSPEKPKAPPTPKGKTEIEEPGPSHSVQKDPTVTPAPAKQEIKQETKKETKKEKKETKQEKKQESKNETKSSTPAPGSKNKKGQVYDPVFGWITPSDVQQEIIDGDGDPDKIIGEMD